MEGAGKQPRTALHSKINLTAVRSACCAVMHKRVECWHAWHKHGLNKASTDHPHSSLCDLAAALKVVVVVVVQAGAPNRPEDCKLIADV